ncbi:YhgE/Pip domain-containing protein [Streptosporangium pseudovulgare]|uniref:Membrane protein n=1 Tax=Streptosporangium pseudovulgare TaxID=35765 RepID=A0ABQ2QNY1_9ACTN|nr:YhgE/Pip domain-containing protein [Streptosporangium pseudovulgare]GGP87520.1 membrane protein [Streptosporangium pseudovulgare]
MRALGPGRLELRRFTRSRLTRSALAGVVMLPLLYAGLYLWSFWDPQGHLENIPVALVMEDRPAKADGKTIDAGRELADELRDRKVFEWHRVSAREAADGVNDGSFYLSLTVPADFSSHLASPSDKNGTPTPAELGVRVDTGRSYIMGTISDAVFAEVREAASRTALKDYWNNVFVSFGELHDATAKAANGADKLRDGSAKAGEGASSLNDGLGQAKNGTHQLAVGLNSADTATGKLAAGAGELSTGLGQAESGSRELGQGLTKLAGGAKQVADGNAKVYRQVHAQVSKVDAVADEVIPVLEENGSRLRTLAQAVEEGADRVAGGADSLKSLPGGLTQGAEQARRQAQQLQSWVESNPDADPSLRAIADRLTEAVQQVSGGLEGSSGGGDTSGAADRLRQNAQRISEIAARTAELAPTAGQRVGQLRDQLNELDTGLGKLADGSQQVSKGLGDATAANGKLTAGLTKLGDGAGKLSDGLNQLGGGIVKLSDGATQVDRGVGRLHRGAGELTTGLGELTDGSAELSDKLGDGAKEIPDYGKGERADRSDMMSEPVRVAKQVLNEVPNYGTGFAPFFVPLALWVGAMVSYMVLRPLNPRLLAGTAAAWRIAVGGWLPGLVLGAAQVGVLLAVLRFGLGMEAAHWAGVAGILLLTAAAFLAVVQAVNALLGPPGRVVVLALLMLQLTSSAGTYPIETSPGFFQTISPWLPMSWVVSALRRLISGGDLTVVWQACGVLGLTIALGLALTIHAVHKSRTWSLRRLHPELSL